MTDFKAITTVYSYYMPEIRDLITRLTRDYPHDVFLRSISPGLDDFHHPIIDRLIAVHRNDVPELTSFPYRYPTAGAEEGIREYLTFLQASGVGQIYVWKGDYEGYREVAKTRNLNVVEVDFDDDPASLPSGHWFLSNPSARNGMIVADGRIRAICDAGHQVFYDLSYLGTTEPATYDLNHPNIAAAAISFSKPFGLFYYRIGFTFSRTRVPALDANKWFKNVYGLLIADRLLAEIDQAAHRANTKLCRPRSSSISTAKLRSVFIGSAFLLAKLPTEEANHLPEEHRAPHREVPRAAIGIAFA